MSPSAHRRTLPDVPHRRGWCPGLARPMPTGDGLLARVHPPLGILTLEQARIVARAARLYGNGHLDLTARANLQIRGVSDSTSAPLAHALDAAGLGDTRHDGGPQRLTLTGPLAGHDPAETLDVPAIARAIEAAGRDVPGLPPKTLVLVEGRPGAALPDADVFVVARPSGDIAITAATAEGHLCLDPGADSDTVAFVTAVLTAFARTGRRRMRDLAPAELYGMLETELPTSTAPIRPPEEHDGLSRQDMPFAPPAGVTPLTPNLFALVVDAPFGRCTADALDRLIDCAGSLGADALRLSPARGFVLLLPQLARAKTLAALAQDFIVAPDDPRRSVAACTGAPSCGSGSTPTLADAARLAETFRPLAVRGHSAHVSGCAKGCARPGPSDLTLVGRNGLYGAVIGGAPGDEPAIHLPIEAVLERLGRANRVGLAVAFAADGTDSNIGRHGRPA